MNKCSICNSNNIQPYFELYDDRYGYPGRFKMNRCMICGHASLENNFTEEQLSTLYSDYYPRADFNVENYLAGEECKGFYGWLNGKKTSTFRWVPKNTTVLDIGCGFCESLGFYESRGCNAHGVEADHNVKKVSEKYGFKVNVGLFNAEMYKANYFDYVTMSQVIEHVSNPIEVLEGVKKVLKPGGKIVLSTPNVNGWGCKVFRRHWINWHTPYHLHLFSSKSMRIAAEKAGLELVSSKTITSSEWLHYQWIHLVTYPEDGHASQFWVRKVKLSKSKRKLIKLISLAHKLKINHLVTRLFDGLGVGDCKLYFLTKR